MDITDVLAKHKMSIKEFSRTLALYLNVEWTDAWYQHIYRVAKGEMDPSDDEKNAIEAWMDVQVNPHPHGARSYRVSRSESTFNLLQRYMRSGIYSGATVEQLFRKLRSAMML
jgi:hypothetical protein